MANKVKFFYNPSYSAADWQALNPALAAGQLGVELDGSGKAAHMKIGPGLWNDLAYIEKDFYDIANLATVNIGDIAIGSDNSGRKIEDIIKDIISPYQSVTLESAKNDAGGTAANVVVKEVGTSVVTSVDVSYTLNNLGSLKPGSNIFISAGGIFTNEGWHTHTGAPITMTLAASLNPTSNVVYTISIYAVDAITGQTNTVSTTIVFKPAILWGNDVAQNISAAAIGSLPNRLVSNNYKNFYSFASAYSHVYIPAMLNPANLLFSEQTNPSFPAEYSMIPTTPATVSVNNGTGTYLYYGYVSEFSLLYATKLKID